MMNEFKTQWVLWARVEPEVTEIVKAKGAVEEGTETAVRLGARAQVTVTVEAGAREAVREGAKAEVTVGVGA